MAKNTKPESFSLPPVTTKKIDELMSIWKKEDPTVNKSDVVRKAIDEIYDRTKRK